MYQIKFDVKSIIRCCDIDARPETYCRFCSYRRDPMVDVDFRCLTLDGVVMRLGW